MKKAIFMLLLPIFLVACMDDSLIDDDWGTFDKCVRKDSESHNFSDPYRAGDSNTLTSEIINNVNFGAPNITSPEITTGISKSGSYITLYVMINGADKQSISIKQNEFLNYKDEMIRYLSNRISTRQSWSDTSSSYSCDLFF